MYVMLVRVDIKYVREVRGERESEEGGLVIPYK